MPRPTITASLGTLTATITQAAPRVALVPLQRLLAAFGHSLAGLLTTGAVEVGGARLTLAQVGAVLLARPDSPEAEQSRRLVAEQVVGRLADRLGELPPELARDLVDELVVGHTVITLPGGDAIELRTPAMVDAFVPDVWTLLGLLRKALEINALPTSAGARTSAGG